MRLVDIDWAGEAVGEEHTPIAAPVLGPVPGIPERASVRANSSHNPAAN